MKPGTSKPKGNAFENKIASILSLWITNNQRRDILDRSPSSGGKATAHHKLGRNFQTIAGDLISVAEEGLVLTDQFIVELKHQNEENLGVINLVFQNNSKGLLSYWDKLLDQCAHFDKKPILIFRQNSREIMMIVDSRGLELFDCKRLILAVIVIPKANMYIMRLSSFLAQVSPKKLQKENVVTNPIKRKQFQYKPK